jgi:hypothetical protein
MTPTVTLIMQIDKFIKKRLHTFAYKNAYSRAFLGNLGILIQECRVCFQQFFYWRSPLISFFRAVKYIIYAFLRALMGRSYRASYSFTGEDRIIEALLKKKITYRGFYVEVGCNEPIFISNTFSLYKKGWIGVCIDANQQLINKFKKVRHRDICICALVSNELTDLEFITYTNPVLSSVDKDLREAYIAEGQEIISQKMMKTQTLSSLLDSYGNIPKDFDLLAIDAEGSDFSILQSLDLNKYIPTLIVLETEEIAIKDVENHPICVYLSKFDYEYVGFILKNAYFKKKYKQMKI